MNPIYEITDCGSVDSQCGENHIFSARKTNNLKRGIIMKKKFLVCLTCAMILLVMSACGSKPAEEQNKNDTKHSQSQTVSDRSETEDKTDSSGAVTGTDPSDPDNNEANGIIEKFTGAADNTGIYATAITLSEKAADKGTVEMIYYGPKGSPQENSVVNTFRIEYYKEDAGTFEINTFYDGEVYQNYHHQTKVKVNNTFGAIVRAGNVTVFYTPDGGEKSEIYKVDAESFNKN